MREFRGKAKAGCNLQPLDPEWSQWTERARTEYYAECDSILVLNIVLCV